MSTPRVMLVLILALVVASCAMAQDEPQQLTERQAEVASVVESLAKALMTGDMDALKQSIRMPLLAVLVSNTGPPQIADVTEDLLTEEGAMAAIARYGLANQVRLVQPTVALVAFNVAVFASDIEWISEAGNVLVDDRMAAVLGRDAQGWRISAIIAGDVAPLEPDEATRAEIAATIDGAVRAVGLRDQDAYMAAFSLPVMNVDPDSGARRLGHNELQAQFRELMYLILDAGISSVTMDTQHIVMLGQNAACAIGVANGLDAAGTPLGYRPQAALFVKQVDQWKIVAQAAGIPEEGAAPPGLLGLPTGE
ncbi:MAG: hypothetical protein ACE5JM_09405 [Armatimonadota bacterium]